MGRASLGLSVLAAAAAFFPLAVAPAKADNGVRPVAQELEERNKAAEAASPAPKDKLSDSAVRVMTTFAFSVIPEQYVGADGKTAKVDKSDPNKFFIPLDDARRVIRVATRSAYAEVCNLPDLERANYQTLMQGEEARKVWSKEQMMFINALHMFSVSYFTGNMKFTEKEEPVDKPPAGSVDAPQGTETTGAGATVVNSPSPKPDHAAADQAGTTTTFAVKKPECTPEQKAKVTAAINAYVQSAKAGNPPATAGKAN